MYKECFQALCWDYLKWFLCRQVSWFYPHSTVCLGPSEAAGGQHSSQLAPWRPLAPQKQEMVIVLHCFSSPYLYPHFSFSEWTKKEKKQMCNNIYVWKSEHRLKNTTKVMHCVFGVSSNKCWKKYIQCMVHNQLKFFFFFFNLSTANYLEFFGLFTEEQ